MVLWSRARCSLCKVHGQDERIGFPGLTSLPFVNPESYLDVTEIVYPDDPEWSTKMREFFREKDY